MSSKLIRNVCIEEATNYYLEVTEPPLDENLYRLRKNREANSANLLTPKLKEKVGEALNEARRKGYEEGYKEGLLKAEEEASSLRVEAEGILEQANSVYREKVISLQKDITVLAVDIAEKILAAQLNLDPETVTNIAAEAVQMMANREDYTVYVSPEEVDIFNVKRYELEKLLNNQARLQIVADPGVEAGGCLIETEQGMVDASLEARWAAMLEMVYTGLE